MPYPNEHACRLESPSKYERFRRVNGDIEIGSKKADAIYGITGDGTSELQAVRFPIASFSESEARSWCGSHDGSFDPAAESESD